MSINNVLYRNPDVSFPPKTLTVQRRARKFDFEISVDYPFWSVLVRFRYPITGREIQQEDR